MVFFVLTKKGYNDLVAELGKTPSPLWVNAGVLTESEILCLRQAGAAVTNFLEPIISNSAKYLAALDTIQEHHPGDQIWVEHVAGL